MNHETIVTCPVTVDHWEEQLRGLIERHVTETGSRKGAAILGEWDVAKGQFLQVCPKEMLVHLPHPLALEARAMPAE
jgi:glutamate synthase (NADPH/NADH) large chain